MDAIITDIIGLLGMICILSAYFLNYTKKIKRDSRLYDALNIVGSVFLLVNAVYYKSLPLSLLQFIWASIALWHVITKDIMKALPRKHNQKKIKKKTKKKK